ncbi:unnamed protein product [Meloidogyne enterolobii]|uniref:Uncharacterized protein n=1 Tax=Meloidogyne enterolobii TaxID=390850 RepID=A0ACB0XNV7_MELEN
MGKLKDEITSTSGSPVKGHQSTSQAESLQKAKKRKHEESCQNNGDHKDESVVLETPHASFSEVTTARIDSVENTSHQKKKKKKKRILDDSMDTDSMTDGGDASFAGASTNNNNLIPSTSQMKEPKAVEYSHSEEDEVDLEKMHERDGSITSNTPTVNVMPKDMYCFCKYMLDLDEQKTLHLTGRKANVKFNTLLRDVPNVDPSYDLAQLQACFVQFYRWATLMSEVPMAEALKKVMDFVQTDHILQRYPEFPKLKSLWHIFINKCGVDQAQLFGKNNNLRDTFRDKDVCFLNKLKMRTDICGH